MLLTDGQNATQYKVTAAPVDGLKVGADLYTVGDNITGGQSESQELCMHSTQWGTLKLVSLTLTMKMV